MQEGDVRELDPPEGLTGPDLEEGTTAAPQKPIAMPEIPKPDVSTHSSKAKPKLEMQVNICWCQSTSQLASPACSVHPDLKLLVADAVGGLSGCRIPWIRVVLRRHSHGRAAAGPLAASAALRLELRAPASRPASMLSRLHSWAVPACSLRPSLTLAVLEQMTQQQPPRKPSPGLGTLGKLLWRQAISSLTCQQVKGKAMERHTSEARPMMDSWRRHWLRPQWTQAAGRWRQLAALLQLVTALAPAVRSATNPQLTHQLCLKASASQPTQRAHLPDCRLPDKRMLRTLQTPTPRRPPTRSRCRRRCSSWRTSAPSPAHPAAAGSAAGS